MKTLYALLAVSFLFFAGTAIAQTGNGAQKSETIKVWGNCGMCKKNIETAAKEAGAKAAAWDKTTKMLAVKYSADQTCSLKIQEKIAAAGYDTRDLLGNDEAYKNLDDAYFAGITKPSAMIADIKGIFRGKISSRHYWSL